MNANALRGLYRLSVEATEAIDVRRNRVARFIGAPTGPRCRNVPQCSSESLNIVAKAFAPTVLEPGDEVCITIMEHHSNPHPGSKACRGGREARLPYPTRTASSSRKEMDAKIGPKDEDSLRRACVQMFWHRKPRQGTRSPRTEQGGYFVVDGAQSVPHEGRRNRNRAATSCVLGKLFGPFGMGVLWGKDEPRQRHAALLIGRRSTT